MTVSPAQYHSLVKAISPDRLETYATAAAARQCDVLTLYLWDRDLAAAAIADIAIVEVAMRNAMNDALVALVGGHADWYTFNLGLGDRALKSVAKAWTSVPRNLREDAGRVVAHLMFGFWRDLLEASDFVGEGPRRTKVLYDELWVAGLHRAFPGGKAVASAAGQKFTRSWTLGAVQEVHALRNRVAHHEPLVNGFPLPGVNRRLTGEQGHAACLQLAALLDRDLAAWLTLNSHMAAVLAQQP